MNKNIITLLFIVFAFCANDSKLKSFKSDGCSLFPDRNILTKIDWCECCFEHDISYWQGGTKEERELADKALKDCVFRKTGDEKLAELMYRGVRFGGSTYFPNWYRWGYGWDYSRKYKPLSKEEEEEVKVALELFRKDSDSICSND